jgi:ABC-type glycerol-3-phosphate transport system substrate-binding protein
MRLPPALTSGVSAAAALLLLTACGGGDSEESASSSSSSGTSSSSASSGSGSAATGSSSDEDVQAFCSQAQTVFTDLGAAFDAATDPTQLPDLLQQATTAFGSVEPPAEIAGSWTSFSDALTQLSASSRSVDLSTPEGLTQFEQDYESLTSAAATSQADVQQYVVDNCPGASAAPSS